MGASGAHAQFFNWDSALSRGQVERMIQASGYRLTGPAIRHGAVYLANVLGPQNDLERLIVDARDGRVLQRFAAVRSQPAPNGGWPGQPQESGSGSLFGWFSGDDDAVAPRPPAGLDGNAESEPPRAAPLRPPVKQIARTDDGAVPHVILAPIGTPAATTRAPVLEKPRPRPEVKRKKFDATPVAQPANTPADVKPTASVQPTAAPIVAPPAATIPAPAPPHVVESKAAPAPASMAAAPAPAPAAAPPKPPAAKPSVNDVPVAPLE
jgi:hypothetical protein